MRHHLVYDWPTRIFHWLFAGLFLTGFVIAKTVDDDAVVFNYHSMIGLTLGFLVIFRLIWGFAGTQHARFSGFALNPTDLLRYFTGIIKGDKKRWAGHNPASSWAALTMLLLAAGLAATGFLMTSGPDKETYEDIHELFANAFVVIVILHVSGIIIHTLRFREMIGLSMIDGKKDDVEGPQTIQSSHFALGAFLLALTVAFGLYLFKNFNAETRSLQFFGTKLQLGDNHRKESLQNPTENGSDATKNDDAETK